jgi:hypothetical protein
MQRRDAPSLSHTEQDKIPRTCEITVLSLFSTRLHHQRINGKKDAI